MFLDDLDRSSRPGILVGGGAYKARKEISDFAFAHGIPCFRTWNALDVITDDQFVYGGTIGTYGGPGRNFGIQNCDLLLSLGCRMSGRITGGLPETFARGARKYIVDLDPIALKPELQQVKGDVNILGDCKDYVRGLSTQGLSFLPWLLKCREWLNYDPVKPEHFEEFHHYGFMRRLSEEIPDNAIIVSDTGGNVIMMGHCFKSKEGQRIFSSNGNTPMGFAFCGALGSWFADPSRPVICIIGDGGFNMNIQEIQTLINYGAKVKTFIINNRVLGNTKSYQRVNKMAEVACGPDGYSPPNFQSIATAYGVTNYSLSRWQDFERIVGLTLQSDESVIVDVIDHDRCNYEPRVSRWDCGIEEMYPKVPEFLDNMIIKPLEGWETR